MKTLVANWKMHLTVRQSVALAKVSVAALRGKTALPEVILAPSFPALEAVHRVIAKSRLGLCAQDVSFEDAGAFTGEVSPRQLKDLGVTHVIIGHSERRAMGETDATINKKVIAVLAAGMTPIICVGERKEERGKRKEIVTRQVKAALATLKTRAKEHLVFAYEPIWAIGTGDAATPEDAVAMHACIRETALGAIDGLKEKQLRVLYGGSVNGKNAQSFLCEDQIDGLLVGGASLKPVEWKAIITAAIKIQNGKR